MTQDPHDTRAALLQAAGELFAEFGYDGASTRAIARRANTNMASIAYHFGGKEPLYLETLQRVLESQCTWGQMLESALALTESGTPVADALESTLRQRLGEILSGKHPVWETQLLLRALLEPSPAARALLRDVFAPQMVQIIAVAQAWNPALTGDEAKRWGNALFGQEVVYALARNVILDVERWDAYPATYLDDVARYSARLMAGALWPERFD
jgi:AcrR family transcriptional regulator